MACETVSKGHVKKGVADLVGGSSGNELMGELGLVGLIIVDLGDRTRQQSSGSIRCAHRSAHLVICLPGHRKVWSCSRE